MGRFEGPAAAGQLIDTSVALIALSAPERLSARVREAIESGANVLSVLSFWEVALKSMKGRLDVGPVRVWWVEALDRLGARPLTLRPQHVEELMALPAIHSDPFDRMLLAQAMAEGLDFVSTDGVLGQYGSERVRIIC